MNESDALRPGPGRPVVRSEGTSKLIVNITSSVAERVRALAVRERRSLSMQVEMLLERALDAEQSVAA